MNLCVHFRSSQRYLLAKRIMFFFLLQKTGVVLGGITEPQLNLTTTIGGRK